MKILFLFHEAKLTGATLNLFRMVKWLSVHSDHSMTFLLREDGVLSPELRKIGRVHYWNPGKGALKSTLVKKALDIIRVQISRRRIYQKFKKEKFDLVYANTIGCSEMIASLQPLGYRTIWHIHEMELAMKAFGSDRLKVAVKVDRMIANSGSTRDSLMKMGIAEEKIRVLYPVIDFTLITAEAANKNLRKSLGIPEDAFLIGSSGTGIERKGMGTFIQLARMIEGLQPGNPFYYLWVGKILDPEIHEHDIRNSGMANRIILCGEQEHPFEYYRIFDVFVSCSKEESFGLAAMEAGALGKPMVCFEHTGGLAEVVKRAQNLTVPYLDSMSMAEAIIGLHRDPARMKELGTLAAGYARNFDQDRIMSEFEKILKEMVE